MQTNITKKRKQHTNTKNRIILHKQIKKIGQSTNNNRVHINASFHYAAALAARRPTQPKPRPYSSTRQSRGASTRATARRGSLNQSNAKEACLGLASTNREPRGMASGCARRAAGIARPCATRVGRVRARAHNHTFAWRRPSARQSVQTAFNSFVAMTPVPRRRRAGRPSPVKHRFGQCSAVSVCFCWAEVLGFWKSAPDFGAARRDDGRRRVTLGKLAVRIDLVCAFSFCCVASVRPVRTAMVWRAVSCDLAMGLSDGYLGCEHVPILPVRIVLFVSWRILYVFGNSRGCMCCFCKCCSRWKFVCRQFF